MTLSHLRQATCVKLTTLNETTVVASTLYIKPLFSGPTANSNNDYDIQTFLDRKGVHDTSIVGTFNESSATQRTLATESTTNNPRFSTFARKMASSLGCK
jgi:hypothetical protein